MTAVISGVAGLRPPPGTLSAEALALRAAEAACADAAIDRRDVDAIVKLSYDGSISTMALARELNVRDLAFNVELPMGGGSSGAMLEVARVVLEAGLATNVLCFRAVSGAQWLGQLSGPDLHRPYYLDTGNYLRPAGWTGYLHLFGALYYEHSRRYGTTRKALGDIAVNVRANAIANGARTEAEALTLDDYLASPTQIGPFGVHDAFTVADTATAFVLTTPERVGDRTRPVAEVVATAQIQDPNPAGWYDNTAVKSDPLDGPSRYVAERLYKSAGITPNEIDVAGIYDCSTFTALYLMEESMLCDRGAAAELVAVEGALSASGARPVNLDGGDLASGYTHGLRHVAEAARQLRGAATAQVADAEHALVMAGPVGVSSGAILRRMELS